MPTQIAKDRSPPRRGPGAGMVAGVALVCGLLGGALTSAFLAQRLAPQDSAAEQIAVLDQRIAQQGDEIRALKDRIAELSQQFESGQIGGPAVPGGSGTGEVPPLLQDRDNSFGGYADLMLLSARRRTNGELRTIPQSRLVEIFGLPAENLGQDCARPTSDRLTNALVTRDVGPFNTEMLAPAAESLARIFAKVREDEPALYENLRSYGGLCARLIRGSTERISRHAFGLAIDVSVGGTIDAMGDGKTQFGLILLAEYFQDEGWLWGAAFGREDSMHFEVSAALFERWLAEGLI